MLGCTVNVVVQGSEAERPRIRASDVVFMYAPRDPSQYEAYAGTVVGWGGRPGSRNAQEVEAFRRRVAEAHRRGMRYCASVDFLVDFRGFIDFRPQTFLDAVCRDLDGNPIRVPWLWDHQYKGHPAYWWCTNNPDYRAYLRDQVERACLAPIDGLHIDDYSGTSACSAYCGGCFCPYCRAGFREYLEERFSVAQLREIGIERIEDFDYRAFLRARGIAAEHFRTQRAACPLGEVFQDFQNWRMKQLVRETFEYAEKIRGRTLLRSVNSSASSPRTLLVASLIDYFCGEMSHRASEAKVPLDPLFVFRLVEALQRRQTATASGRDWAWIKAHEKPGLVRTWIAQAYAFGNTFMVPHRQWCFTPELGTHWWEGKPEDFAYLYRFVRQHAPRLDGYVPLANTALVYSNANFSEMRAAARELSQANIPYAVVLAGDENLPVRLRAEALAGYDYLIVGSKPLPNGQQPVLEQASAQVVRWEGLAQLPDAVRKQVLVRGSGQIRVSLRHKPFDPTAPLICHLLNQNYDLQEDAVSPVDVQVSLSPRLLDKAGFREALVYMPARAPVCVPIARAEGAVSFEVRQLGLWALVELKGG